MKHFFIYLSVVLTVCKMQAQPVAVTSFIDYRSTANPYYWKNKMPFAGYWQQDVAYVIKASLDDQKDMIDGELMLTYYNNSPDILSDVYFHLYQNAFQPGSYYDDLQKHNKIKTEYGKNEKDTLDEVVEWVKVNGAVVMPSFDNTIMKIHLPQPMQPGGVISFNIKFKSYFGDGGNVRRRMKLFYDDWKNKHYDGVHWYPRICVYDRKFGWETDQHLGREFYGDFGTYDVELTLPAKYINEATGELQNEKSVLPDDLRRKIDIKNFAKKPYNSAPEVKLDSIGTKTWKYHAINVHDFAFTCDPTYRIAETTWNGIRCIGMAQEPHASGWQNSAELVADVLKTYSRDFGMYLYPKMVACDARDGMEYPMLTLDGGRYPDYNNVISHEIGHNWFFGMVGNNETYRAFMDEGFTQFLTSWYMSSIEAKTDAMYKYKNKYIARYATKMPAREQVAYIGYMLDAVNDMDETLNQHSDGFNGAVNHGGGYRHVYYKTATMLWNLQYVLGDSLFQNAMKNYFNEFRIAHPYPEDFRNSIIHYTHVDLNWFFDQWLETNKHIDYEIEDVNHKGGDTYEIVFEREGRMQMPVDFTVTAKDGKTYEFYIPNTYFVKNTSATVLPYWRGWDLLQPQYKCTVTIPSGISKVEIDPTHRLADIDMTNNYWKHIPTKFTFDHQIRNPVDRFHLLVKWRPDIWWNNVDGIKAGIYFSTNYMDRRTTDFTIWYNTGITSETGKVNALYRMDYRLNYKYEFQKDLTLTASSKLLEGLYANSIGLKKTFRDYNFYINVNSLYRPEQTSVYLIYPELWNESQWNNFINIGFHKVHNYIWGYATQNLNLCSNTIGSDYLYGNIRFTRIDNISKGKFDLRVRSFIQLGLGNHPPESQLMLAGANNEELMDSKFTRSRGFVPESWRGFGSDVNHFQQGGGLNIRGFAGYLAPVGDTLNQVQFYKGTSGVAINAELDFDRLVKFQPKMFRNWLHLDVYAFADAGIIADYDLTPDLFLPNNIRTDAGLGAALTIKRWWYLGDIKPLTIRADFPVLINPAPAVSNNFELRYVIGIGRVF
jgi:hypothetical protein